ncbi:hypothetical protein Aab01nite_82090 [Paractinoplanes abujensis]|uniref:Uncharacterized protein n=1 Tax=Paractinoplanes abujensis TaxID=882441 RepID=A0A7W7G2R0_9ACTN|nr:hypothetical protein [Actinoplanes abujensis]GID24619.1 hypothetical protein Aab01nite_82090 [Actinoplanes abujensis]
MPEQESPARPSVTAGEQASQTTVPECDGQSAPAPASGPVQQAKELRRRVAAVLRSADTRLRRSEVVLASSNHRLRAHSYAALPATNRPAEVPSRASGRP